MRGETSAGAHFHLNSYVLNRASSFVLPAPRALLRTAKAFQFVCEKKSRKLCQAELQPQYRLS